jgi:hypothetical protein
MVRDVGATSGDSRDRGPAPSKSSSAYDRMIPRLRVVICCVTFETVKVVNPIKDLRAEKVHILHWDGGDQAKKATVYADFYQEVVDQLHALGLEDASIVEKRVKVYRFKDVLRSLISIMSEERRNGNDVYINVSAGTTEFAAAATLASMMVEGVKPFTVHARAYTISGEERIREVFSVDGKLVGQTKAVAEPVELPTFQIDLPPRDLVLALREFRKRKENKQPTRYTALIKAIKDAGAWTYEPGQTGSVKDSDARGGDRVVQAEKMYYSRHYIDGWIKNGWVDGRSGRGRELEITESGRNVTDIFYLDSPLKSKR